MKFGDVIKNRNVPEDDPISKTVFMGDVPGKAVFTTNDLEGKVRTFYISDKKQFQILGSILKFTTVKEFLDSLKPKQKKSI